MLPRAVATTLALIGTVLVAMPASTGANDAQALLYTAYRSGTLELRAISPEGTGARTVVSLAGDTYAVALSPDRKTLAAEGEDGISTIKLSDAATRVVARNAYEFSWSPDSRRIAYRTGAKIPEINVVRIDGSGDRRLTRRLVAWTD